MPVKIRGQFLRGVCCTLGDIRVIFWNGAINCAVRDLDNLFLVSVDIETQHVQEKLIPSSSPISYATSVNLRESLEGDNLYVFVWNHDNKFATEIIKLVKGQWENFVLNYVDLNRISAGPRQSHGCRLVPFSVMSGTEGEGDQLLLAHSNGVLSYNLVNKTCRIIREGSFGIPVENSSQLLTYNPTLFFP